MFYFLTGWFKTRKYKNKEITISDNQEQGWTRNLKNIFEKQGDLTHNEIKEFIDIYNKYTLFFNTNAPTKGFRCRDFYLNGSYIRFNITAYLSLGSIVLSIINFFI